MVLTDPNRMLRAHWIAYLIEGIILVILGAAAIFVPTLATQETDSTQNWPRVRGSGQQRSAARAV